MCLCNAFILDQYGGQTTVEREDGWFDNDVTGKYNK
jgi:hypothetical protein